MESLPKELLLEILSYVQGNDLIELTQTSQFLADFIKSSPTLMKKFTMSLTQRRERIDIPGSVQVNVIVKITKYPQDHVLDNFRAQSSTLRNVKFRDCRVVDPNSFVYMLRHLKILKSLTFEKCEMNNLSVDKLLELDSVKRLEVTQCSWVIFKILALQVYEVKIAIYEHDPKTMRFFYEFLARNEKLKVLDIAGKAKHLVSYSQPYPFNLTKLKIDNFYFNDANEEANMLDFLKNHCLELEELVAYNAPRDAFLRCILGDMRKLERLELGTSLLPELANFIYGLKKNESLRTLVLRGDLSAIYVVKGILRHYPGLTTLQILNASLDDISDILITVSDTHKRLEHLTLPGLTGKVSPVIKLKSINSLKIVNLQDTSEVENLAQLLGLCPNVTKLTVDCVENAHITQEHVEAMLSNAKQLQKLSFGENYRLDEETLNVIKAAATNLRIITIYAVNVERERERAEKIFGCTTNCLVLPRKDLQSEGTAAKAFNTIDDIEAFLAVDRANEYRPDLLQNGDDELSQNNLELVRQNEVMRRRRQRRREDRRALMASNPEIANEDEDSDYEGSRMFHNETGAMVKRSIYGRYRDFNEKKVFGLLFSPLA